MTLRSEEVYVQGSSSGMGEEEGKEGRGEGESGTKTLQGDVFGECTPTHPLGHGTFECNIKRKD